MLGRGGDVGRINFAANELQKVRSRDTCAPSVVDQIGLRNLLHLEIETGPVQSESSLRVKERVVAAE